jgi:hypothetical protein
MGSFKYTPGKLVLLVSLTFIFSSALFAFNQGGGEAIRFNSEYKLKRMSNGEVIISHSQNPGIKNLTFTDFYADILLAAYRNQKMDYIIRACTDKYFSSEDECRREVKHAVNVLSGWNIIIVDRTVAEL